MHHLLGKFVQFVQVESGGEDDVAAFLRNEGWCVIVNSTAKSPYAATEEKVVRASFFEIDEEIKVTVPTADCLLADKLACFAPSTIGYRPGSSRFSQVHPCPEVWPHSPGSPFVPATCGLWEPTVALQSDCDH